MPYAKDGRTYYAKPEWFPDEDSDKCHIIVCDEFNRAPQYVQQTMLPFSVGGQLHTHFLPRKSIVVFLCNPDSEEYHTSQFNDAAFYDRMARFSLAVNLEEWLDHAERSGVSPSIISAVIKHKDKMIIHRHVENEDNIHVQPSNRTFTKLGILWNNIDPAWLDKWGTLLATAYVGREHAITIMKSHQKLLKSVPEAESLLNNINKYKEWLEKESMGDVYNAGVFDEINLNMKRLISKDFDKFRKNKSQLENFVEYIFYLGDDQLFKFNSELNEDLEKSGVSDRDRGNLFNELNSISNNTLTERIYGRHKIVENKGVEDPIVDVALK